MSIKLSQARSEITDLISDYGIPVWLGGRLNKRGKWRWVWTETRVPVRATKWGWAQGGIITLHQCVCVFVNLFLRSIKYFSRMSRLSSRGREWAGVPGEPGAGRGGRGQDMGGRTLRGQEVHPVIKHKDDIIISGTSSANTRGSRRSWQRPSGEVDILQIHLKY